MKRQIVKISNDTGTFMRTMSLSFFLQQYREAKVPSMQNKMIRDISPEELESMLTDGLEIVVVLRGHFDGRPLYARQNVTLIL